jgi:hypothetical protein
VEERVRALFRPFASALTAAAALLVLSPTAASAAFAPGSAVEGHVGSTWSPCTTVGAQQRFGGYVLHCASLPDDNVFSESDVRPAGPARAAPRDPPAAAALGRPVQGYVFGTWEACTTVGAPQPFGGQVLHCPSLPDDNVFSATDVREIGGAPFAPADQAAQAAPFTPPAPVAQAPAAPAGRQVQGNVFGVWETCTLLGAQQGSGGYLLHCPSLPDDHVFSASDTRL